MPKLKPEEVLAVINQQEFSENPDLYVILALGIQKLTPIQRYVLAIVATRSDSGGCNWNSDKVLAKFAGMSSERFASHVARLINAGFLLRMPNPGSGVLCLWLHRNRIGNAASQRGAK